MLQNSSMTILFLHANASIWAANQNIRMISEGSCDTEDWSNHAENSALHNRNKVMFCMCLKINQLF